MNNKEIVERFFAEVQLPEEWLQSYFRHATIRKVQVSGMQNSWRIFVHAPELIPAEIWHEMQVKVKAHFQPDIRVFLTFTYDQLQHDIVLKNYKFLIQKQIQERVTPAAATWFGQANWQVNEKKIEITFPNPAVLNMAKQRGLDRFVEKYYLHITGVKLPVELLCRLDSEGKEADMSEFHEKKQKEEQAILQKALAEQQLHVQQKESSVDVVVEKKIGVTITDPAIPLSSIHEEERRVVIEGKVFKAEVRDLRSGRKLLTFHLTDLSSSMSCKLFASTRDKEQAIIVSQIRDGDWLRVRGSVQFDSFSRDLVLMVNDLNEISPKERQDLADEKRIELHLHTSVSAMDGITSPKNVIERIAKWGHSAVAITDHAVVQAFPDVYEASKKTGVKILYGVEANIVDDGVPIVMNETERDPLLEDTYVVFDVETTGLSAVHDVIIEVGAVKMKKGEIVDRFSEFVNPHRPLSHHISELTQITNDMLVDAPEIDDVIMRFLDFIDGSVLVAHNARFDMGFLQEAVKRLGQEPVSNSVLDTLELARFLYPKLKNHRLNTLAKKLEVKLENHHRAIYDAEATGFILWKLLEESVARELIHLHQFNEDLEDRDHSRMRPFHAILLVQNQKGMKNLYQLITKSHINYFYRVPRIPRSELLKHRDGLIIGSGCEKGELYDAALNKSSTEVEELAAFYDYLEIQPRELNMHLVDMGFVESAERLKQANQLLVQIGEKLGKPVVATSNAHYLDEYEAIYRDIVAANRPGMKPKGQLPKAYLRTTDEMLAEFAYLGETKALEVVVTNPKSIAERIEVVQPFPEGTYTPDLEGAEEELKEICYRTIREWYGDPMPEIVQERLDRELGSIIKHGFSVLYMISQKIVAKSLEDGYLVGSRGSVGSSLVATLSYISEVNPLPPHYRCEKCQHNEFITDGSYESGFDLPDKKCPKCDTDLLKDGHDIPFETFLGFEGDKAPDIDLNFDGEYQLRAHAYTEELFGKEYIFRAGSINTVKDKTGYGYVKKYAEQNELQIRQAEIDRLSSGVVGVKRSTGQHPGGLMVIPQDKDVHDFTPIQHPADDIKSGVKTTHFDYKSISGMILKLDLLGHTGPTIQRLLHHMTGVDPNTISLSDENVIELFRSTKSLHIKPDDINGIEHGTLGIPEFGTYFARNILKDSNPTRFSELVRVSGLSHGTDVWQGNVQDLIKQGDCTLSEAICCRDDIMLYLIRMGLPKKTAFKLMEKVRKGKGLTDEEIVLMRENNVPEWYIGCCQKIKYMFPRAHAAAYVTSAVRIGWYKVYHPTEFYAAMFTSRVDEFDIEDVLKGYQAVKKKLQEISEQGMKATQKEKQLATTFELVLEMYARGVKMRSIDLYQSDATRFQLIDGELLPPFASIAGVGENAAQNIVTARKDGEFLSKQDLQKRTRVSSTVLEVLDRLGCLKDMPTSNQLALFNF